MTTYSLIAIRYDDNDIEEHNGLTREDLIKKIAEYDAPISRYERWNRILWWPDSETDYSIKAEADKLVAATRIRLAAEKEAKDKAYKEQYAAQQLAQERAHYEKLKAKFEPKP